MKATISKCSRSLSNGLLKKKTPILRLTILQLLILSILIISGAATILFNQYQQSAERTANSTPITSATSESEKTTAQKEEEPKSESNSPAGNQKNNDHSAGSSNLVAHNDEWGCTYYTGFSGTNEDIKLSKTLNDTYEYCVSVNKQKYCVEQESLLMDAYFKAKNQAQQSYDDVKNGTYMLRDKNLALSAPPGVYRNQLATSYNQGIDYAYSEYKSIYDPAYNTYNNTVSTLNSTPKNCGLSRPTYSAPNYQSDYIH